MNTTTTEQPHSTAATAAAQKPKAARQGRPAAQKAHGAPPKARSAPKATTARKPAKSRQKARHARPGSKTAKILDLLRRPGGASLPELHAYASHCTSLA